MSRFPLCVVPLFLAATMWADDAGKQLDAADSLAAGCSEFACKLYGQIRTREGNLCLSPFSISTAGAMLTAGANGDTAKQLNDAFVFPAAREDLLKDWRRMRKRLGKSVSVGEVTLRLANAAWFEKSEPPIASYTGALDNAFRAHVFPTSFRTAPDAARSEINAWVARATRQRGMQLFGLGIITGQTAVVLVNAAYFQGSWRDEFDRYDTKRRTFHLAANRRIRVPTMRRQTTTRYAQHRMLKVVPLSYKSCSLEMILLVPEKVDGLADVEAALTGEKLAEWLQPGKAWRKSVEVKLYLPKFRIKSDFRLKVPLQALGVKDAFS
ncbi:MAG: hypothetical protein KAI66_10530, partial [Lentisphaeria bacterium]|nr:hypothetical protein [Lentisphaeria bacterium]